MLTLDKIYHAAYTLKDVIRLTDLIAAPNINRDSKIYLKTENLQITGSFKVRGSSYKIAKLSDEEKKRGVIACSAGNHAQGVALAAAKFNIPATICLPDSAPISKIEATRSYGAELELVDGVYDDAYARALELKDKHGYTMIHPFDDEDVIAGQGTVGLEILQQLPDLEAVIVPIGGGGLASGIAYTIKTLRPEVKVYGVQAIGAAGMFTSKRNQKIECLNCVSTFADGIAVKKPGELTYKYCNEYLDEIVTVTDDEIATAILTLIEEQKLIAEGAGAVAVAAAIFNKLPIQGKKTVCIVSGGNIDVTILSRVIKRGLQTTGRSHTLTIELLDKPGQLMGVSKAIAQCRGNIIGVFYERANEGSDINGCFLKIDLETRNFKHLEEIINVLKKEGFKIV